MTRHSAATLCQGEGGMLVSHQLRQSLLRLQYSLSHCHVAEQDADGQGVDEYSQCPVGSLAALHAAEQDRTEYHVFAACSFAQHLGPIPVDLTRSADSQRCECVPLG